jgi:DNA-binding NarL/FixJ family response regulator
LALKIVLVDDQPVPGLTLRRWLRKQRDLEVVGEAVPGSPVLALIPLVEPDVVLLDVNTSPEAGLNVARMIRERYPKLPIVAIGDASAGSLRVEAAEAGAWAYFPRTRPEDLARAIPSVIAGRGKGFIDLAGRGQDRPQPESFVALPDEEPRRKAPVPTVAPAAELPAPAPTAPPLAAPRVLPAAPKGSPIPGTKLPSPTAPNAPPATAPRVAPVAIPSAPVAPPVAPVAAAASPAKTVEPPGAPERARRGRQSTRNGAPGSTFELRPVPPPRTVRGDPPPRTVPGDPPPKSHRDVVAWSHSSLEPVFGQEPQRKPRRRRDKKERDEGPQVIDVRGPTGLPRRFGGHR